MKQFKRLLSLFLALTMLVTLCPTAALATEDAGTAEITTDNIAVEGTTPMGSLISAAMTEYETEGGSDGAGDSP